jgi:hypothetical protein
MGGKLDLCTNLHGMYRWFDVVHQGGEVFFPSFFVVIFGALCWWCFEDDFSGFWWVSLMRILCLFDW